MNLTALRSKYTELVKADAEFWASAGDELPTGEKATEVKDRNKAIEELEHQIVEAQETEGMRAKSQERQRRASTPVNALETPIAVEEKSADRRESKSLSDQVLDDAEFKQWREQVTRGGAPTRANFGHSPNVGVKTLITGVSATSAGALVVNQNLGLQDIGLYQRPLTIVDLLTTGTTTSDTVDFVREGTPTNNAAPVAEATATSNGSGAKPESAMVLSLETTGVKTIAHWIPASRQALADAGQLRMLIDRFLTYGLNEELEDQIITGSGVGANLTGILNTSGIQAQAYSTDILETARKGRTKVRIGGRTAPTAYGMHPNDWEDFDLLQDNEARYFFGGPSVLGNPRLWGLPVVESEAFTEGQAVVADWRYAALWMRMGAQIMVSDQHSDFFVRNLIAILAELRAALGIIRPQAFVTLDLTA